MYSTLNDIRSLLPEETIVQLTNDENAAIVSDAWQPAQVYAVGAKVIPAAGSDYYYEVTAKLGTGTSGASAPSWPTVIGGSVIDNPGANQLIWACMGLRIPEAVSDRVSEAIETADAEIDGYCAVKYTVPLSPVPTVVSKLSVELAIYYLYSRRTIPEKIEKRYDKAVARLKDIARGLLTLGVDPEPVASATADSAATNRTAGDRVFTHDSLKGF